MLLTKGATLPNIFLVIWDTARAQNLSCYGYDRLTAPHLDALASRSLLYRNAYSVSPWSLPSHASLFTGLYPSEHNVDRRRNILTDLEKPVMAECLQRLGYQTVGFSSNTWVCSQFGFDRGFDRLFYSWQLVPSRTNAFEVNRRLQQAAQRWQKVKLLLRGFLDGTPVRNIANGLFSYFAFRYDKGAWLTNTQVRRWLKREYDPTRPFFMFINYMEPHLKFLPPADYRARFLPANVNSKQIGDLNQDSLAYLTGSIPMQTEDFVLLEALYDAEIFYLDQRFHELLSLIETWGALENSIIIVTSDHGENIGDHGMMDHQYCLYDSLLKVPLLIRMPGATERDYLAIDQIVETKDILTTLLEILDAEDMIAELGLPKYSLRPEKAQEGEESVIGRPFTSREYCFSEYLQPQPSIPELISRYPDSDPTQLDRLLRAVVSETGLKFIWSSDGKHELYDLIADPAEVQNLYSTNPEQVSKLDTVLEEALPRLDEIKPSGEIPTNIDPVVRRRLEELGYL